MPSAKSELERFDREWALSILERALLRIRTEATESSKPNAFEVLQCFLPRGSQTLAYDEAAARLGLTLPSLKTEVHRLRRRFRQLVREEVALTVSAPHEVDEEMRHLQAVLMDGSSPIHSP
jgi:RNA polymerase sigma-70 factor (ECF subfamily)